MTQGPGEILDLIRSGNVTTRGGILAETGLSRATVAQRIDALIDAKLIRGAGDDGVTGGRRATRFAFDPDTVVVAVALDLYRARMAIVDAHGRVVADRGLVLDTTEGPERTLGIVLDTASTLLAEEDIAAERLGAVGISLPGPIDPATSRLLEPPTMPLWNGWPIVETVRDVFDVPVYLENDADAMAYGEWAASGAEPGLPWIGVKLSEYIGAGLIIGGRIYRGLDGGAGDIGHVDVGGVRTCRCGRVGCLATVASGDAIVWTLRAAGVAVEDFPTLIAQLEAVSSSEPAVLDAVRAAGEAIGRVLAAAVGVLNPAAVVLTGELAVSPVIAAIRSAIYGASVPRATRHLTIRAGELGGDAALVGVARVALDDLFSAAQVNRRLTNP
ncbi:ROK family protein [Microbacterium soli]|uniref:ROK family protein n=2 Tax=Microbacterium soli TaxID=446075 RepID=A0ABP7MJI1_9MICO